MYEIIDDFKWEKDRKLLTNERHNISGLKNVAHFNLSHAAPSIPMHFHSNIVEMHCLTKGRRECLVNGESHLINGNELFITFPFEEHQIGSSFQWPCEFYTFQLCLDPTDSILGLNKPFTKALFNIINNLKHRRLKVTHENINHLVTAFNLFAKNTESSIMHGTQHLCCFLFNIPNLQKVDKNTDVDLNPSIKNIIGYIDININESLNLYDLSKMSGYSLTQFKVNFKKNTGINPIKHLKLFALLISILQLRW